MSALTDLSESDDMADCSVSRPSKNNRHGRLERLSHSKAHINRGSLPVDADDRPISVDPDRGVREEAQRQAGGGGEAKTVLETIEEWRDWYMGYENAHMEFTGPEGQTVRTPLENSYQPRYGKRYYARIKDLERAVERRFDNLTTVMISLTASNENLFGDYRCPADLIRDIMGGYNTARKQLYNVLEGAKWEYARIWEPHDSGYHHFHLALFIDESDIEGNITSGDFEPVLRSYVENCDPAGWEAHRPDGPAVSVNRDVQNLGSYLSEYIGAFGDNPLERPMKVQMFYAICWATQTRRVDFSNGANEMIQEQKFIRETGLRPEDRGSAGGGDDEDNGDETDLSPCWTAEAIVRVEGGERDRHDVTPGRPGLVPIEGDPSADPPKQLGGPPPAD